MIDVDLECHETMEPMIRVRAKAPYPTRKDFGFSPVTSTSSASWLLNSLGGQQYMQQSNTPAPHRSGASPRAHSTFTMASSSPVAATIEVPQGNLKLTKSTLSGQREVLHLPSRETDSSFRSQAAPPGFNHGLPVRLGPEVLGEILLPDVFRLDGRGRCRARARAARPPGRSRADERPRRPRRPVPKRPALLAAPRRPAPSRHGRHPQAEGT
jgi:hypothetical protein